MKANVLRKILSFALASVMAVSMLAGCGSSAGTEETEKSEEKKVLRVGMECAYAPFNWTQETKELSNGDEAVPIYGTGFYAYGYDVMVAQKLADEMGMELEVHKVDWNSIGISLDAGDDEMVNVCITTRKDDTQFRDQLQDAMDAIGWNDKDEMDKLMEEAISLQPAAN